MIDSLEERALALRKPGGQLKKVLAGESATQIRVDDLDGIRQWLPIAIHEPIEFHGGWPEIADFRQGAPSSPLLDPVVQEKALDHDRQEGNELAAPLETAQHRVVVYAALIWQNHRRLE